MMGETSASFNLVDRAWIVVRMLDGSRKVLSIREVFHLAESVQCPANDIATQDFAILRLLIAVLQRAVIIRINEGDFDEDVLPADVWGELWKEGLPLKDIDAYLDAWHDRFDLLDAEQPFMQVADLASTKGEVSDLKKVLIDVPDGLPLFSLKSGAGLKSLSLAEAARCLVTVHAFDTSGIKTGVVGDPSVKGGKSYPIGTGWAGSIGGVYLEGNNLAETLLLNLILCSNWCPQDDFTEFVADDDLPAWEQPQKTPGDDGRKPSGSADLYSWQSRRVKLFAEDDEVVGVVLSNGDKIEPHLCASLEPMTCWRRSQNQEKKLGIHPVYLPTHLQKGKAIWRGLASLLPEFHTSGDEERRAPGVTLWAGHLASLEGGRVLPANYKVRIHSTGFEYGVQSSVVSEMIDDAMTLSVFLMSGDGKDCARQAEKCMTKTDEAVFKALGGLAVNLRLAAGDEVDRARGDRERVMAEAYFELDAPFRSWLVSLGPDTDLTSAEAEWYAQARSILSNVARQLIDEAGPDAVVGRKVKQGKREEWMNAGQAQRWFQFQLRKCLSTVEENEEREGKKV